MRAVLDGARGGSAYARERCARSVWVVSKERVFIFNFELVGGSEAVVNGVTMATAKGQYLSLGNGGRLSSTGLEKAEAAL